MMNLGLAELADPNTAITSRMPSSELCDISWSREAGKGSRATKSNQQSTGSVLLTGTNTSATSGCFGVGHNADNLPDRNLERVTDGVCILLTNG